MHTHFLKHYQIVSIVSRKVCKFLPLGYLPERENPCQSLISRDFSCFWLNLRRREGDSNPRYPNRIRQFSKLLVSATHPSLLDVLC